MTNNFLKTPKTPPLDSIPTEGDLTPKQAMQFQPTNASMISGLVGYFEDGRGGIQGPGNPYGLNSPAPGLFASYTMNGIPIAWAGSYAAFRRILNNPSVRFVRELSYAPQLATKWVWQIDKKKAPKEAEERLQELFESIRLDYLDHALRGDDYGWSPFEQIFERQDDGFMSFRPKPLLHDISSIYVSNNGDFRGLNNNGIDIDTEQSFIYTHDGEAGNMYGRGFCYNLLSCVPWWIDANNAAARYDQKIAGVFMVCHYPPGQSIDRDGKLKENWLIAQEMLNSISAGKPIAVCNEYAGEVFNEMIGNMSQVDRTRWKLELMEDKGSRAPGFTERLTYLDKLIARAFMVPERAAFEAQRAGSRADSESQGDIILTHGAVAHQKKVDALNGIPGPNFAFSPVNNLLRLNWGPSAIGCMKLVPEALQDDKKKFFRDLTKEVLSGYPEMIAVGSSLREVFAEAGMPLPSTPLADDQLLIRMEGMTAMRLPNPTQEAKPPMPKDNQAILDRIHNDARSGVLRLHG